MTNETDLAASWDDHVEVIENLLLSGGVIESHVFEFDCAILDLLTFILIITDIEGGFIIDHHKYFTC